MSTTRPIRTKEEIKQLKNCCLNHGNFRNYVLLTLGLNTALRISDILSLRWCDVYHFEQEHFYYELVIREQKTKKETRIPLNRTVLLTLEHYKELEKEVCREDYLIHPSYNRKTAISRVQAYRIIKDLSIEAGLERPISCHSLRKTFGYQAWKSGAEPVLLMSIYNHSSYSITKRYLGIEQEDKNKLFFKINL